MEKFVGAGVKVAVMLSPRVSKSKQNKKVRNILFAGRKQVGDIFDTMDEAAGISSDSEVAGKSTGGNRAKLGGSPLAIGSVDEAAAAVDVCSGQEEANKAKKEAEDAAMAIAEAMQRKEAAKARAAVAAQMPCKKLSMRRLKTLRKMLRLLRVALLCRH